jgi:hypothetical protein
MRRNLRILTVVTFLCSTVLILGPAIANANEFDVIVASRNNVNNGLPACSTMSNAAIMNGLNLIKSEACTDFAQLMSGAQNGNNIGNDLGAAFLDLQGLGLPAFCAASLLLVVAQAVIDGKIGVGSCPVGGN